jgi:hypothetical protein
VDLITRKYCKEQDIEACVIKLELTALNTYVVTVYRDPCGNFNSFLNGLYSIKSLYKTEQKLILCGDINIDYIIDNERKKQLAAVLLSYNLTATVHFPIRVQYNHKVYRLPYI